MENILHKRKHTLLLWKFGQVKAVQWSYLDRKLLAKISFFSTGEYC